MTEEQCGGPSFLTHLLVCLLGLLLLLSRRRVLFIHGGHVQGGEVGLGHSLDSWKYKVIKRTHKDLFNDWASRFKRIIKRRDAESSPDLPNYRCRMKYTKPFCVQLSNTLWVDVFNRSFIYALNVSYSDPHNHSNISNHLCIGRIHNSPQNMNI